MSEIAGLTRYPLARRGMVMTGIMSGLTLAVGSAEAQAIHTDTNGLVDAEIKIPTDGQALPGYYARPQGAGPFPVVLVIEEVFGVHGYIQDICRRLAKVGYLAVAPELYAREGDLSTVSDPAAASAIVGKAPDDQIMRDLDNTLAWAGANAGDMSRAGITGFCRGGRVVWLYDAHSTALKAAVAWYGPVGGPLSPIHPANPADVAGQIHAPLLGLYGGKDPVNNPADVQAAETRARAAGKAVEIVMYRDAPHAFHADYRPSYRKAEAEDGWRRMLAWFKQYGVA